MFGLVCVPCVENPRAFCVIMARGDVGERWRRGKVFCACIAIPLDESDSHVKVNWVFEGVVAVICWSSKLPLPEPLGGEETAAALAIAADMIPWSDFPAESPSE